MCQQVKSDPKGLSEWWLQTFFDVQDIYLIAYFCKQQ